MTASETRLRADARRNRDQIVAAARQVFAAAGPDVPMEEIARTAGVGVGTLYRRFPDREALIRAVARESFAQVLADAREAAAEEPTAWDALVRLAGRSHQLQASVQLALVSERAREILKGDRQTAEFRDALLAELDAIVRAAQAEGSVRADIGTGDVAILLSLVLRRPSAVDDPTLLASERVAVLMLDGLRARPGSPLPGRPITGEDLQIH
ncbi:MULTISPECIES: TetR/AcrR family transcriptional regulator [Amycolatopsis]|uniref:TetR/AcrR family transcriptional regulator n=1 Tax=Amycolatopsis thermalba TaxID=944492 RepID=A0ABY4NR61_9PSEU|nr:MULTISPECIES: TetR/AcrR family transcriptional regulator [Amycolatopsis]OXM73785.1 TetR family transcriptional regulator [Amycolatopsis sp. KNN50.9b]UQS22532.1 TetR/AcrR family transcriptional regulator [Amycolatopsis thermalba]